VLGGGTGGLLGGQEPDTVERLGLRAQRRRAPAPDLQVGELPGGCCGPPLECRAVRVPASTREKTPPASAPSSRAAAVETGVPADDVEARSLAPGAVALLCDTRGVLGGTRHSGSTCPEHAEG
jgi:hypothetical protein